MIKNIIFDVGDILLGYRWKEMLLEHGLTEEMVNEVGERMFNDSLWNTLDLANLTVEEVIGEYHKKYPKHAESIAWFIENGEKMHVPRPDVWEKIPRLKDKGYGIYLLSNYSEGLFKKHTAGASFMQEIDGMVVSYQVHITKPDNRIYRHLLDKYDLNPEECIFFDDRVENTEAAKKMGIESVTITSKEQLLELLEKIISEN